MRITKVALAMLLTAAGSLAFADWPQWRGPNRDGIIKKFTAPASWPDQLKSKWKVRVGVGHSSPLTDGGRAYLHSRLDDQEVISGFDLESGKVIWQDKYPVQYTMNPAATGHGKGPKSTPVIADGRLYTFGITEVLSCYQLPAGKLLWRHQLGKPYKQSAPDFGTAMSPLVDGELLIVYAGGIEQGALLALDRKTGEKRWSWSGDGPAYASPIVITASGTRQIVTQSRSNIISVSAASGELLWKIHFTTEYDQNIITPLAYKDLLIFSGLDRGVFAVRPVKRGSQWAADQVWINKDTPMYMSSPVLSGDLLFGFTHKSRGQFFCIDAQNGQTKWRGEPRQGDNAAMLVAGGVMLLLKDNGELVVARPGSRAFEVIKVYKVADSPTWAHPGITSNGFLIKDAENLALWTVR
jgi:outer membrane protein assembly factor BamB